MKEKVFVIAEAGVNHDGDLQTAKRLIDVAAEAGANAVKFQTFRAGNLVSPQAPKAPYQTRTTDYAESQLEMLRRLELSEADHIALIAHAKLRGIAFLSSPFDLASLDLLASGLGLRTIKIASGEITNGPLLLAVARAANHVILSTGMSTLDEIQYALGILAFGFTSPNSSVPETAAFADAFASEAGSSALKERVVLLHCTTEYPAPFAEVNLRAMDSMATAFGLPVGYSDHTTGVHISLAAVARGACVIEKHFTLDRALPGPDHAASIEPKELRNLVRCIRDIEAALGDGIKTPSGSELINRDVVRKSLVAAKPIQAGDAFTRENVVSKRPGTGLSPNAYWRILGKVAARNYEVDELLDG